MRKKFLFCFICLFYFIDIAPSLASPLPHGGFKIVVKGVFNFSPLARQAYDYTFAMRWDEAHQLVKQLRISEPNNRIADYIDNQLDCFKIFIDENKSQLDEMEWKEEHCLNALEDGDSNSPYYLFTRAQTRLLWAMNRSKFNQYLTAFNEISAAYSDLEKNRKKFPDFKPNKLSLGILHAIIGSIPDNYKWGVKFLTGMNGTTQQGQNEIEEVIGYAKKNDFIFEQEAIVEYAFLMLHLNNQNADAWNLVNNGKLKPHESLLACFAVANVAQRTGRNDRAIELLKNKPTGVAFYPFPYLDYMLGVSKMNRGDGDAAVYIGRFIDNFKGRDYIKEAWLRLGWIGIVSGDVDRYKYCLTKVKSEGHAEVGGDKNAMKYTQAAFQGIYPDRVLMKSRLLFDGGYYQQALDLLQTKKEADYKSTADQLEYCYRSGRILQALFHPNEAISFYSKTIQLGKSSKFYYACNASLQLGIIYEQYKNPLKAKEFYGFCLTLKPDDYMSELHSKAKAGLARVGN
jgi:hypothetical protein